MLAAAAPYIPTAASAILSFVGGKKDKQGTPQQMQSGINALEEPMKRGTLRGFANLLPVQGNLPNQQAFYEKFGRNPQDLMYSQQGNNLQQQYGDQGILPVGVREDPHRFQQQAWEEYGAQDFSPEGLAKYMQPFNQITGVGEDSLNRTYDQLLQKIQGRNAALGSRIRPGTNEVFQNQLNAVEQERGRALKNLRLEEARKNLVGGLNLREQSLGELAGAGADIRGNNQEQLNLASGGGQYRSHPLYGIQQAQNELVNPYLGAQNQTGPTQGRASNLTRFGALADTLGKTYYGRQNSYGQNMQSGPGMSYGEQGNFNQYNGQQFNSTNNIQGTPWNASNPYGY